MMTPEVEQIYRRAFELKNSEQFRDSVAEFKRILDEDGDPANVAPLMIAMLCLYELDDHEQALPHARRAVELKPNSERASLCLVHCLFDAGLQDEVEAEIRRYVQRGGKIDLYQTLFEENGLTAEDFAKQ